MERKFLSETSGLTQEILSEVPTPSYIIDERRLRKNLEILQGLRRRTDVHILLAQKCFSMYYFYPMIGQYLDGTASSGLYEARLGHEAMRKENHVFSPAYKEKDMRELVRLCNHIIFNSFSQWEKFKPLVQQAGISCGMRINPECSTQEHEIYDPCASDSRLGVRERDFRFSDMSGLDGIHFHTLCEQDADALEITLKAVERNFGEALRQIRWINFGVGHHITRDGYDMERLERCIFHMQDRYGLTVYLEPGEAVALDAGFLVSSVIDIQGKNVILDTSAACHMPDVLEMPYRPPVLAAGKAGEKPFTYMLGGPTCLAGDKMGEYSFDRPLSVMDKVVFGDMAIYTMVKTNTFNGMPLPDILVLHEDGNWETIRHFAYEDFKMRL